MSERSTNAPYPLVRRYPLEPLERLLTNRLRDRLDVGWIGPKHIADELGEDPNTIRRARSNGLQRAAAERLAEAAGFVPCEVWPEILNDEIAALEVECAAPDCPVRFIPPPIGRGQKRRIYHERACQVRTNKRRRYREDPVTRERIKASARRYKAEIAEAARRRAQAQDAAA